MKKIIILFCICYVCCNITSCFKEKDTSKCETHNIEISGYSCFKFKPAYDYDIKDLYYCNTFPEKAEEQKLFWRLSSGFTKEAYSSSVYNLNDMKITLGEKSFYKKGEIVTLKNTSLTEEDKKILNNKNTCLYQFIYRYSDNNKQYPNGYPNITDPNICFNVDSFNELKGLLNCGFANISYTIDNKTHKISSCFFSVGNKATKEFQQYLKKSLFEDIGQNGINGFFVLLEILDISSRLNHYKKNFQFNKNELVKSKRQLEGLEVQNYEIIVEDKNGKVIKYSKDSESIQVIKAGNPTYDDDDEDFDIFGDNSSFLSLNIIISLLLIILNL